MYAKMCGLWSHVGTNLENFYKEGVIKMTFGQCFAHFWYAN